MKSVLENTSSVSNFLNYNGYKSADCSEKSSLIYFLQSLQYNQ